MFWECCELKYLTTMVHGRADRTEPLCRYKLIRFSEFYLDCCQKFNGPVWTCGPELTSLGPRTGEKSLDRISGPCLTTHVKLKYKNEFLKGIINFR